MSTPEEGWAQLKCKHQLFMAVQAQSHPVVHLSVFLWKDEVLAYEKNITKLLFFLLLVDQNVSYFPAVCFYAAQFSNACYFQGQNERDMQLF